MTNKTIHNPVPVNEPLLSGNEKKYLTECIDTGWISSEGPFVKKFESAFATSVGRKHGIAVTNGTAALQAAVAALDISDGDEIILPAFTIISCAAAVVRAGATPVLVDCDPVTWNMEVSQIEAKITPKTKAIMPVHIYGLPVDMAAVETIAKKHNLKIIEDAAEAHGQSCYDRPCGSFGDISIFSFYPNKLVTTGEGGMIATDDDAIADRCRQLRNLCFQPAKRFVHEELGWNFRMTNLQAAVGLAQLEQIDEFAAKKRRIGKRYTDLLGGIKKITLPAERTPYAENIYWVYGILLNDSAGFDAADAMARLREKGIGTRPFFWPMHQQPVFQKMGLFKGQVYPAAERIAKHGFYIPSGPALTDEQADYTASCVKELF